MLIKLCSCPFQIYHYFTIWATAIIHLACSLHPQAMSLASYTPPQYVQHVHLSRLLKKEANVFLFLKNPFNASNKCGSFFLVFASTI